MKTIMSEERRTIEVDTQFLEDLYGLVGKIPPGEKNINLDLLKDLLLDIKRKMEQVKTNDSAPQETAAKPKKLKCIHTRMKNLMKTKKQY